MMCLFKTLHSNLVIFQLGDTRVKAGSSLALHSNLVIFQHTERIWIRRWKMLYIPIWLYSNNHFFTSWLLFANFTFQSGYIPTDISLLRTRSIKALHSNLVIFQLTVEQALNVPVFAFTFQSGYIPTSIPCVCKRWGSCFTFQSGYIPTLIARHCELLT